MSLALIKRDQIKNKQIRVFRITYHIATCKFTLPIIGMVINYGKNGFVLLFLNQIHIDKHTRYDSLLKITIFCDNLFAY